MKNYLTNLSILANALPFLLLFILIAITIIFQAPPFSNDAYIQSTGCGISIFSGLGIFSLVPMKPAEDKPKRLTKEERAQFNLSTRQQQITVGCILGDLHVYKDKRAINGNACLHFKQSTIHTDYLLDLYEEFKELCPKEPKVFNPKPDKRTGEVYSTIRFWTRALPCFNEYYNLFYLDGRKIVPSNIGELLTALSLGYWIWDDGTFDKSKQRVILSTDSFTLAEVELLINVLNDQWNLECSKIKITNGGYRIVIPRRSLPILQSLLGPIMPAMMNYKIGL